jgi:hypothetical protein
MDHIPPAERAFLTSAILEVSRIMLEKELAPLEKERLRLEAEGRERELKMVELRLESKRRLLDLVVARKQVVDQGHEPEEGPPEVSTGIAAAL